MATTKKLLIGLHGMKKAILLLIFIFLIASIALIGKEDGGTLKGTVSDNKGKFILEDLAFGIYQVHLSFIG